MPDSLALPSAIAELVAARNKLRSHFALSRLSFTFDGNLVGDLGEAMAVAWFGIRLSDSKVESGIDGYAPDGRRVQVKATGTGGGPAFRHIETRAEHLLFFAFDYDTQMARVVYNGPERYVTSHLPKTFAGQRMVSMTRVVAANKAVLPEERLPMRAVFPPIPRGG